MFQVPKFKVLAFTGHYLPGFKGGGPIRTMASLVETLGDAFDFSLVTLDRDLGSSEPYPGIQANSWQQVGKARVCYLSPEKLTWSLLRQLIRDTPHDILYLNSFFSVHFGILPLLLHRLGVVPAKPIIVAPRGQFSLGALQLKSLKKRTYLAFFKALRLHGKVLWQVSSLHEQEDVLRAFGCNQGVGAQLNIAVAPNLPDIQPLQAQSAHAKEPGTLRIVFLSRISPMKNLDGALEMLTGLRGTVAFHIYGPLEDAAYWERCQRRIERLPANIKVHLHGMVPHEEVVPTMAKHDLFFLPTLGENYGHVIIEALAAGCPVLISDQTAWRNLEAAGVGWDLPLDQPERFTAALQRCVDMSSEEMAGYSARARTYAERTMTDSVAVQQNRDLFLQLL